MIQPLAHIILMHMNGCGYNYCAAGLSISKPLQVSCSGDQEVCAGTEYALQVQLHRIQAQ